MKTGCDVNLYTYYCQDSQDCQFCPYLGGDDRIRNETKAKENGSKSSGEASKEPFLLSDKLWDKMLIFIFLIAGVVLVLVYSVKGLKSIGWLKSKCYLQFTTSTSDINYNDYYIQFGLKDNSTSTRPTAYILMDRRSIRLSLPCKCICRNTKPQLH